MTAIIAGIIQTVTGFGAAVFLMLFMPYFFDMIAAPAVTSAITVGLSLTLAWKFRKYIKLKVCLFPTLIYLFFSIASINLAKKLNLPVIIHSRDATKDTLDVLKNYSFNNGVIHCFSGSLETAKEYINLGFLIGIGGVITFSNSNLYQVVEKIPLEKIVLETDSPYLAPVPFRGTENSPKYIPLIASKIAEIKKITEEEVAKITTDNAIRLFDLK